MDNVLCLAKEHDRSMTMMGSNDNSAMVVNQVAKLRVGNVVDVNPCKGLHHWSQQLHGATTPMMEDRCRSTTTTSSLHKAHYIHLWHTICLIAI